MKVAVGGIRRSSSVRILQPGRFMAFFEACQSLLQHSGVMNRGSPSLVITIVPDSGSGQLEGIRGTMAIRIEGGKHSYELNYTLGTP